jgi:Family of unknown function (DUF6131)
MRGWIGFAGERSCRKRKQPGFLQRRTARSRLEEANVIVLGLILLLIGLVAKIAILWTIGLILLIIGAVLWLMGSMGRAVGGRRHYW